MSAEHRCTCSWPWLPTEQKCDGCKAAGRTFEQQLLDAQAARRVTETVTEKPPVSVTRRRGRPPKPDALTPAERAAYYRRRKKATQLYGADFMRGLRIEPYDLP